MSRDGVDYPLLMIASDVDPIFVMPNEVIATNFVSCNLVDARVSKLGFLEVERLITLYHSTS